MLRDYRWSCFGERFFVKEKKKAPTALEFSIIIIIGGGSTNTIFFCLYNSLSILPFLILHPLNLPFQFMSARAQLKAFCSGESFFSKPVKTSLTNLTINFCETFLFEWALGFLRVPFGGTRLQENCRRGAFSCDGLCSDTLVWQKLTSATHDLSLSCLSPAIGEVWLLCGISAVSMLLGNVSKSAADPCLGPGAGAGRVAAAVPLSMTSLSHSSALSKSAALNLILLNFEALWAIHILSFGCKWLPCLPATF